jgi:predicted membrane protein
MSTMNATNPRRVLLGIFFLAIGSVLFLHYTNLLPMDFPGYLLSWKTILIALGALLLATEKNKSTGFVLMIIGSVFLAKDIFSIGFWDVMQYAIPAVFLIAGILILFPGKLLSRKRRIRTDEEESRDFMTEVNIFGGGSKAINSTNFRGGEITCIFGGTELNFRNAQLADGINVIDITCIFGGVTLYVPEDWTVKVESSAIFGAFSDARAESNLKLVTNPDKVLVIKGVVVFGGGEIKAI